MSTQQALRVLGTLLFLYGVFGYIFPEWGKTLFSNNENLFHVLTGLGALLLANFSPSHRRLTLLVLALLYLGLGIYGFTLAQPTDFRLKAITAQLDDVDNYIHVAFGLAFAWFWLNARKTS